MGPPVGGWQEDVVSTSLANGTTTQFGDTALPLADGSQYDHPHNDGINCVADYGNGQFDCSQYDHPHRDGINCVEDSSHGQFCRFSRNGGICKRFGQHDNHHNVGISCSGDVDRRQYDQPCTDVVIVEFFAGLLPVTLAATRLGLPIAGVYFSEVDPVACHVSETNFPSAVCI